MLEGFILGIIQGVAEWLPVSSEALLLLVQVHVFGESQIDVALRMALFLHLGTVLAALVYYWGTVKRVCKNIRHYKRLTKRNKKELTFYVLATLISGVIGFSLYKAIGSLEIDQIGRGFTIGIGVLLLITAGLQFSRKRKGHQRDRDNVSTTDAVVAGVGQGLAVLPGISRSGTTTALLLLRNIREDQALELSFVMSIPLVIAGNIILGAEEFAFSWEGVVALVTSFIVGLVTIHVLVRVAKKINFGWFVFVFGLLAIIAGVWIT